MENPGSVSHDGNDPRIDRRLAIKTLLGVGVVVGAAMVFRNQGDAARRGYSGPPRPPSPTPAPTSTGGGNSGSDGV